jgi:AcrR family transcriptional regulator
MPLKVEFDRDTLLQTALTLVRRDGFEQLSTRSLASAQGCSTRPVYTAFASMQALRDAVAGRVLELLLRRMAQPTIGKVFVDMGIGYVAFARQEPALFKLFVVPSGVSARQQRIQREAIDLALMHAMQTTEEFGPLSQPARARILLRLRVFTHGLACYVAADEPAFHDPEQVVALVRGAGRAFYLDEVGPAGSTVVTKQRNTRRT